MKLDTRMRPSRYRTARTTIVSRLAVLLIATLAVVLGGRAPLLGQSAPTGSAESSGPAVCPEIPPPHPPANPAQALVLLRQGQQAAIAGNRASARELLAEAARLDPTNADAAYHHARLLEDLGESTAARGEYCRFLSLPVSAADSAEVSGRITALPRNGAAAISNPALEAMARGAEFLSANDPRSAERAFSQVVYVQPALAEAYLNRAIAREAMGRAGPAIRDYREYLQLAPNAPDRPQIEAKMLQLAESVPTPGTTITRGLLLPGAGQFSTRRPALGAAALVGVAGSGFLAAQTQVATRTAYFEHPFDPEQSYSYEVQERVHPYLLIGVLSAAAITVGAAVEAYLHSRSIHEAARVGPDRQAASARVGAYLAAEPARERIGIGLRYRLGD